MIYERKISFNVLFKTYVNLELFVCATLSLNWRQSKILNSSLLITFYNAYKSIHNYAYWCRNSAVLRNVAKLLWGYRSWYSRGYQVHRVLFAIIDRKPWGLECLPQINTSAGYKFRTINANRLCEL